MREEMREEMRKERKGEKRPKWKRIKSWVEQSRGRE